MSGTNKRAAEVLRKYAGEEESEVHRSGPLKGRCEPKVEAEIAEYRALAAALERQPAVFLEPVGAHGTPPTNHKRSG